MKVLVLISSPTLTGVAAPVAGLARRLHQNGLPVEVATDSLRRGDLRNHLNSFGIPIFHGMTLSTVARPDQYVQDAFRLARKIRQEKRLVLLAATSNDIWTAWAATKIARRSVPILGMLSRDPKNLSSSQRATLRRCTAWLSVRKAWIAPASEVLYTAPERFLFLSPDVDKNRFYPLPRRERLSLRDRWGFSPKERVIGFVGRFKPDRGAKRLIRAFARIEPAFPSARLLMVGFGEDLSLCRWLAARHGLSRKVHFTGFLSDSLPDAYRVMDALMLPVVGNDGIGRAALEARACGVPVWSPTESALKDLSENGMISGGFLNDGDPEDLHRVFTEIFSRDEASLPPVAGMPVFVGEEFPTVIDFLRNLAANIP